jgi:hypothetical protein
MTRNIVHPGFPYTEEEIAATSILLGSSAEDAKSGAHSFRLELAEVFAEPEEGDGWFAAPAIGFGEQFTSVLMLISDIHAGGTLLTEEARSAVRESWALHLSSPDADRVLHELYHLGVSWGEHHDTLKVLLTRGAK